MTVNVVLWNLEWATPRSPRGKAIAEKIWAEGPEVVCLTETVEDFFGDGGYTICSEPREMFVGYPKRRKVVLWSRHPWREVDVTGDGRLTDGRFVRGVTETAMGEIEVMGVCIPWSHSHVTWGRRDCKVWEDHVEYLQGLKPLLDSSANYPRMVLGDFNQQFPRKRVPARVHDAMVDVFESLEICTADAVGDEGKKAIDHLAHSRELAASNVRAIARFDGELRLSDHFGLTIALAGVDAVNC